MTPLFYDSVVEDSPSMDTHIDQCDINVALTYGEHEMMCELLCHASSMIDFASPYSLLDLPLDSDIVQRSTMIENLRERFNTAWADRFNVAEQNV